MSFTKEQVEKNILNTQNSAYGFIDFLQKDDEIQINIIDDQGNSLVITTKTLKKILNEIQEQLDKKVDKDELTEIVLDLIKSNSNDDIIENPINTVTLTEDDVKNIINQILEDSVFPKINENSEKINEIDTKINNIESDIKNIKTDINDITTQVNDLKNLTPDIDVTVTPDFDSNWFKVTTTPITIDLEFEPKLLRVIVHYINDNYYVDAQPADAYSTAIDIGTNITWYIQGNTLYINNTYSRFPITSAEMEIRILAWK